LIGELLALRAQDVDFLRRSVRIDWQLEGATRRRVTTKTPRSCRTIPLPSFVADALAAHIAEFRPLDDGTMFYVKTTRRPWRSDYYGTRIFKKAVTRAGLPGSTSSHDLRHHFASVLLAGGESVVTVAELLGHDDATLVLTTYGHLMPGSEERSRRVLDEAWCAPGVPLTGAKTP
jgi:integrase